MKSVIRALLLGVALVASTVPAAAERVEFAGTLDPSAAAVFGGTNFYMLANFTPGSGTAASVFAGNTWATTRIILGTTSFGIKTVNTNKITVKDGGILGDASKDFFTLNVVADTAGGAFPDDPVNSNLNNLTLDVRNSVNINPLVASAANIYALAAIGNTNVGGSIALADGRSFSFTATVVPEPGSIALLSGLGLVVAGRIWKRRSAKKQNVA